MPNAAIFFADGLEEIEGLTVVDLFRRADIAIDIVSVTDEKTVAGAHNITIQADKILSELDFDAVDMLILPGGMPGTLNLGACEPLCRQLKLFNEQGKYVAAICAAPSVLGQLGILEGRAATCYPGFEKKLTGAITHENPVVVDGNIITSRGMGTAIEFAAELIALLKDRETAEKIKKSIIYNL
ncbi:MAG: DJ-1 family glyoxalase III [Coprococcus sp.]